MEIGDFITGILKSTLKEMLLKYKHDETHW